MRRRIGEIMRKEFRQALREPRMRAFLVIPPIVQLLIFGFAVNLDVENTRIGWMDLDRTPESRELLAAFEGSRRFIVVAAPASEAEVEDLLDYGRARAVIRVLPGFARDLKRSRSAAVQILVDGADSNTASIVASYATQTVAGYSATVLGRQQREKAGPIHLDLPVLTMRSRVWFNPELKSRNYFVPGVVVNIITLVTLMLTAMAIVREKEIGTMEQLMVTPIRPVELMLGKTLPFALVGIFDLALVTSAALLLFHVPFRGNIFFLLACAICFLMTTLGAGLFISTISRTQQQAMLSTFLFFQPFFLLSGFSFPVRNMPPVVQYLTYLNPVRYFLEVVRGIFLKGSGFSVLWPQMLALFVIGVSILTLSAMRFHKRLD